jgi:hypothetical protein
MLILASMLMWTGTARAEFVAVEDFDDLMLGPINGQNGWSAADPTSTVEIDPAGGPNQVLSVITESTRLYRETLLLDGTIRMLFMRFRYADQLNISFGLSDHSHPFQFSDFDPELSLTNAAPELRINDGGTYEVLTTLEPDTWYNCWMLIDNQADQSQVWLHSRGGEGATGSDQLDSAGQTVFDFRTSSAGDLINFYIKTGGGSGVAGPLYLDDIYQENTDALNLSNPSGVATALTAVRAAVPATRLGHSQPNPLTPATVIPFTLAASGRVEIEFYDVMGRAVARLVDAHLAAGEHSIRWDGRGSLGQSLPGGTYFYRLEVDGVVVDQRKVVISR